MKNNKIDHIISLSNDLRWQMGDEFHDSLAEGIYADAAEIVKASVHKKDEKGA